MDCEKFDQHLMDALFDELDEVTGAAMKRHTESCSRCNSAESGLRATLEVGELPLEEPSPELEQRILKAANAAQLRAPWPRKIMRTLTWAGNQAMRPQLAMAALLVLVLGSSVLLLRGRPRSVSPTGYDTPFGAEPEVSPVPDSELQHSPGESLPTKGLEKTADELAEGDTQKQQNAFGANADSTATAQVKANEKLAAPQSSGSNPDGDAYERALANYRAGRHRAAQRDFAAANRQGGANAGSAALYEARAVRGHSGCRSAVGYYDRVRRAYGASQVGADAMWEQADCYRALGQNGKARALWRQLRANKAYRERAAGELASRGQAANAGKPVAASRPRAKAPAPPATAAPPASQNDQAADAPPEKSGY